MSSVVDLLQWPVRFFEVAKMQLHLDPAYSVLQMLFVHWWQGWTGGDEDSLPAEPAAFGLDD